MNQAISNPVLSGIALASTNLVKWHTAVAIYHFPSASGSGSIKSMPMSKVNVHMCSQFPVGTSTKWKLKFILSHYVRSSTNRKLCTHSYSLLN